MIQKNEEVRNIFTNCSYFLFFKIGLHKLLMTYTESNHEKENIF